MEANNPCCGHSHKNTGKPWFTSTWVWMLGLTVIVLLAASFIPALEAFRHHFFSYAEKLVFPMLIGIVLGGAMDYYIPPEYISKYLASKKTSTIFYSVGLGFLMSGCSHGILALSMELHKKGASGPSVIAFLLASPWSSLPLTFLLIGFFGVKAFIMIGLCIVVAIITGLGMQVLDHLGWIERNKHSVDIAQGFSIRKDLKKRWADYQWTSESISRDVRGILNGARGLMDMVLLWVIIGTVLASVSSAYVPTSIYNDYFSPELSGLLLTLVFAAIIEVCSEGTSPLAFEIYRQTGAFGNSFAFLMGGVVTDFTEISLVWANIGKRTALWMVGLTIPQVILVGYLLNLFV